MVCHLLYTLLKETFGAVNFGDEKWPVSCKPKTETKWPPFGRDYFRTRALEDGDKKPKDPPINQNCAKNLHTLFYHALSRNMSYSPETISQNLSNTIRKIFSANFDYMVYYGDDSEEIRNKKRDYWVILIDNIASRFQGRMEYKKEDLEILSKDAFNFSEFFRENTKGTYTYSLLPQKQIPEESSERNIQPQRDPNTDNSEPIGKDIKCLYFLAPTLVNIKNLIETYFSHSRLCFFELPVIRLIASPERGDLDSDRYCVFRKEGSEKYIYNIEEAAEYSKKGRLFYAYGTIAEFQRVKPYIPNIKLVVPVPERLTEMVNELAIKRFDDKVLDKDFKQFHKNITVLSNMKYDDTYYLRCPSRSTIEYFQFAGFLDALIDPKRTQAKDKELFYKEYGDVERFLDSKYSGHPSLPYPIISK